MNIAGAALIGGRHIASRRDILSINMRQFYVSVEQLKAIQSHPKPMRITAMTRESNSLCIMKQQQNYENSECR